MATIGQINLDSVRSDEALAAAREGDPLARWTALEACRAYLRLVVGKNRWPKRAGVPATSDLVQNTILEGWCGFARFEGRTPGQLRAWLRVILVHSLIKAHRRPVADQLDLVNGGDALPGEITPPSVVAERDASHEAIETALRSFRNIIERSFSGGFGRNCRSRILAHASRSPTTVPKSSMVGQSPGCDNCWGQAMPLHDGNSQRVDDTEQARVIACDALLRRLEGSGNPVLARAIAQRAGPRPLATAAHDARDVGTRRRRAALGASVCREYARGHSTSARAIRGA